jgi:hypothetical protein
MKSNSFEPTPDTALSHRHGRTIMDPSELEYRAYGHFARLLIGMVHDYDPKVGTGGAPEGGAGEDWLLVNGCLLLENGGLRAVTVATTRPDSRPLVCIAGQNSSVRRSDNPTVHLRPLQPPVRFKPGLVAAPPDSSLDLPPLRGGLRSLSVRAGCVATTSRAQSELLS